MTPQSAPFTESAGSEAMSFGQAHYLWTDSEGRGRNRTSLFRRSFHLKTLPEAGTLSLFADTRYRLIVNGETIQHGPARFFTIQPEFDTVDIGPYIRRGENVIAVVVNSAGGSSFHNEASIGGLVAGGEVTDDSGLVISLAADSSWRAIPSPGHWPDTPTLSFALNAGEFLDARAMPEGWDRPGFDDSGWPPAVPLADQDHWGPLRPRSIPPLDERLVLPRRRLATFVAIENPAEEVHSLMVTSPHGRGLHTSGRVMVMTYLHSPRSQEIVFGAWWGRYWMNGEELKPTRRPDVPLRQDFTAPLRAGWNLLQMVESLHGDWWDFYLTLPRDAGLTISAEPREDCPDSFLIGGFWEEDQAALAEELSLPLTGPHDLPAALGPWRRWPRGQTAQTPCRDRARKLFERLSTGDCLPSRERSLRGADLEPQVGNDTLSLLFDFGTEVLGRPTLDFTAAAGTVIDLTYNEDLCPDGRADVHFRHFVDMAERYIARNGQQRWQTFHPRGFRYLEVLVQGSLDQFELIQVGLTRAQYPVEAVGWFECSDPVLNEIWEMGRRTQAACMEDAYLDCPGRERGLYSGDFLVQFYTNLAAFGDTRLFRRCIILFLQAQGENGLVPGNAHGTAPGRPPGCNLDYGSILVQAALAYWSRTGDLDFLREIQPRLERFLAAMDGMQSPGTELLNGDSMGAYIDLSYLDKSGVNCALNCFYERGFRDGARILALLGNEEGARHYIDRANHLARAIRKAFWSEERGVFLDRRLEDRADTEPSVPANALAILYNIAPPDQAARAADWLAEAMRNNFRTPDAIHNRDCNVTSYFSFFALGALYHIGRAAEAEDFMRRQWGRMLDQGAWTCWEYFADEAAQSRCHAWSSSPTHYLSTEALGVRFPEPGNINRVSIRPAVNCLEWASGVYPHPAGPLKVRWKRRAGCLQVSWDAPEGVTVTGP